VQVRGQPSRPLQAQVLTTIDAAEPRTSISDGCTDRSGHFVFGTANMAQDRRPIGSFYQYSHQRGLRRLALPVVVTAGSIAFSPDGKRMYFADTARGAIMQCDYDAERAKVSGVSPFAESRAMAPVRPSSTAPAMCGACRAVRWSNTAATAMCASRFPSPAKRRPASPLAAGA
jgi:sugar lactone lactonase YvrE